MSPHTGLRRADWQLLPTKSHGPEGGAAVTDLGSEEQTARALIASGLGVAPYWRAEEAAGREAGA